VANWYALQQECKQSNVKPIFGNEFYCKPTLEKPNSQTRYHLVCLAMNDIGLQNINKMQRLSSTKEHKYYKPLLAHPILFENTEGIFVSTACSLSYINQNFLSGNDEEAYDFLNKLLDNFGRDNVSIELQYHPDYKEQAFLNDKLIEMYDNTDTKYIINTFDSHVLTDNDRILRKKIQSIGWKKSENEINDTLKSNVLGTSELSFKFAHESGIDDDKLIQKCIDNTYKIAKKVHFQPKEYDRVIPKFNAHKHFKEIFLQKVV
jgi:DNA polymerase III alpha subunit